jgi:Ca-activated chloride channel homolog
MRLYGVLCLTALLGTAMPARGQVFRAAIDTVSVGVTVVDRKGALVTGLTPEDFALFEEGTQQEIRLFAGGDTAPADKPPLHIGLLFDTSGSMDSELARARTAAIRFCNVLSHAEDITLVDFDNEVRVTRFTQDDFPRFVERLRGRKPDGWTALYDALGVYLDGTAFQDGEKVVVVYTDGFDTRSVMTFTDAVSSLKASDVTVYVVGFLRGGSSTAALHARSRLTQLAEATGGVAFFPSTQADVDQAYTQVLEEVNARYLLGYVSSNPNNDGRWRTVDVRLLRPDLKSAKIRARKGYYSVLRDADQP